MKNESLKMLVSILFTLFIITIYSIGNYKYEKEHLIKEIDKKLFNAAITIPYVLADDFHDRTISIDSISENEDLQNIKNLTDLNDKIGTKFLYTVIKDKNGTFRLTSSSALIQEIKDNKEVRYFTPYPDASESIKNSFKMPLQNINESNKIYEPMYVPIYSDRWGTYRSVAIPIRTQNGNLYTLSADIDITYVNTILRNNIIQTIFSFFLFLVAIIPIIIAYKSMLKKKNSEYNKVHKLYIDHSKKSLTDPLTKLYNRYKLDVELNNFYDRFNKYGERFLLLILDLDHFKKINDIHGHQTGDKVLQNFSKLLKDCSDCNDIVGRWGGEEFLIISPNKTQKDPKEKSNEIHKCLKDSAELQRYNLTVSIGVGEINEKMTLNEFIKTIDDALYKAKDKGRNQTIIVD